MYVDGTFVKRYCKSLGNVKDFNLKVGPSHSILLDEKYFCILFHNDIALLIKASLSCLLVFARLTFKNAFKEQDISYLWESEENVNQLLKEHFYIQNQWFLGHSSVIRISNLMNFCFDFILYLHNVSDD